ncbi:MAG: acylphosphatase [Methanocalculus sp. MSAO_Arc1]|uniref:acylphosphatase n=1 Tax=Methanocalculus sp. MSAO_Arc1 TaxID=2293854 RepID=UPI000FF0C80D|nr:acylphosphatase [Methanocalculus sp. MSAO_Arc1]RQD81806.1 MAG: acylphosphatase [Methanocalculus sp. MSAO_Arc1]
MKRFVAIADGRVQRVGYRDHVFEETFGMDISGYVKNLDTGEVEIVAEGQENDLLDLIKKINIIHKPIAVQSFRITWEQPTGVFSRFEIIRGDIQDEIFERMDYAGKVLHSIDRKMDTSLDKQDQMLEIGRETKEEIVGLRKDTGHYLEDEFKEIKKKLSSIEDALVRAGIQV